jgi:hypothetical protein
MLEAFSQKYNNVTATLSGTYGEKSVQVESVL